MRSDRSSGIPQPGTHGDSTLMKRVPRMGRHDLHDVLLARCLPARRRGRPGAPGGGRALLVPRVLVRLVVEADVENVLVALGRPGERLDADVVGPAVAGQ